MADGQPAAAFRDIYPVHSAMIPQASDTASRMAGPAVSQQSAATKRARNAAWAALASPHMDTDLPRSRHRSLLAAGLGMASFDELVAEALAAPFTGWDFSWLDARTSLTQDLPWSYTAEVRSRAGAAAAMLDMGTGGGERLASIRQRPDRTVATESWAPNVGVADARLRPLGIPVVHCDGAPANMSAEAATAHPGRPGLLPFADGTFDLVINKHESFRGDEVARVLAPGGVFVTQQVDYHNSDELYQLLGLEPPPQPETWLPLAASQLTDGGLLIVTTAAGQAHRYFDHVGAVIYYLKIVSWAIADYRLDEFLPRLREAWRTTGAWPWLMRERRFLVVAAKPGA
jgi:SAM-dependent methyltransferase